MATPTQEMWHDATCENRIKTQTFYSILSRALFYGPDSAKPVPAQSLWKMLIIALTFMLVHKKLSEITLVTFLSSLPPKLLS